MIEAISLRLKRPASAVGALLLGLSLVSDVGLSTSLARAAPSPDAHLKARDAANALLKGDTGLAVDLYTQALSDTDLANDRRATLLNDRAVAYVRLGRNRAALSDYNKAVELFPEYAPVYNNRGNLLMALGFTDEALKDFNRAVALAPGYAAAYNNRAGALMLLGKRERAVEDFTRAVRLLPTSPAPLSGRGRAHLIEGRPHAAIRDFSRAVAANERFSEGYRSRAEAKLDIGHFGEAVEDLSRAIAFEPESPNHHLVRGHAYLATDDAEAAKVDFTRVIELAPRNSAGYEARGLAQALKDELEPAFADLNAAISLNPRSATAFSYRAFAYLRSNQIALAERDLITARKLDSTNVEVLWVGAEIDRAQQRDKDAVSKLRAALKTKPGFKRAKDALITLGQRPLVENDVPVPKAGRDGWRVVERNNRFFALSDTFADLCVPLEMMGEGTPKILGFEERAAPYERFGLLVFAAGSGRTDDDKPIPYEQAAIIDKERGTVVAIQPNRAGEKRSEWTWGDDGRVRVASVDGFTDDLPIAVGIVAAAAERARAKARYDSRRRRASSWDGDGYRRSTRRRRKKKSFFQLLFGG